MGKNKKRKLRNEEEELSSTSYPLPPSATPSAASSASELRKWAELPELVLHSIFTRLLTCNPDLPDFLSFSSVCRSWKSFSATYPTSFPPLLLRPEDPDLLPRWSRLPFCRIQTLLTRRTFQHNIPPKTLTLTCLGYSNGRLIFLSDSNNPLLVDVFTGKLTWIRLPPVDEFPVFRLALLVDENLFLLTSKSLLLSYRPGTDSWSRLAIAGHSRNIISLAFHRGKLFALDFMSRLMFVDLGGGKDEIFIGGWNLTEAAAPVEPPEEPSMICFLYHRLVECGGELLLLRLKLMIKLRLTRRRITVYRLDFERSMWVRKESLGDWCIFLDTVGHCPVACPDPARWGGRSNCVYFAGTGPNDWVVVPLDEDIVTDNTFKSLERVFYREFPKRLLPVWVYPSFSGTSN